MNLKLRYFFFSFVFMQSCSVFGQDISLYKQFNGRYDFVFFGNTLNKIENGTGGPCEINTSSSASLNLNPSDIIENAYLYWAGSGTGDFNVSLNGENIVAQRTFSVIQTTSGLPFFGAFTDITSQVQLTGNGIYTFSELDLTAVIGDYCGNGTNFGGWAIVVVYKNNTLQLNQLNVYDGLQFVPNQIDITLDSLNVLDNLDAKIGFVAWEGDLSISVNETLRINGNPISNPPLNPVNNAFNGTNSFTGSSSLYNMDLDVYNIQNNINIGDTSAEIQLTSNQDFVMINTIVTKLNSQLPDATIAIQDVELACDSREIVVNYTIYNSNSTNSLPLGTPVAIYANGFFIKSDETKTIIPIDGSESNQIVIKIPDTIPNTFDLQFAVDDIGTHTGIVAEINENNNTSLISKMVLWMPPKLNPIPNIESCNQGLGRGVFDFSSQEELVKENFTDIVSYYKTQEDAEIGVENGAIPIYNTTHFIAETTPKEIFIRVQNDHCYSITSFLLNTNNCPPIVHNAISPNEDDNNEKFTIDGLRDIFLNYKIAIYNRWGFLIWTGNNTTEDWDGFATKGILLGNHSVPDGTYFYFIELNDPDYQKPLVGFLYLTR